jgi:spore coat protein CotH
MSKEMREHIDKFLTFLNRRKIRVGDEVLCIKNFKFIKKFDKNDYNYVSKTRDSEYVKDMMKGKTYLFNKGDNYKVIRVSDNSVEIESDVDKLNEDKETQIFLLKSVISKYETDYFPIFSEYFKVGG